jgi:hypothetical protein
MDIEKTPDEEDPEFELLQLRHIKTVATELFVVVWRSILRGQIVERGPVADKTLELRAALNPNYPEDSDWLPEPLASERQAGYPGINRSERR